MNSFGRYGASGAGGASGASGAGGNRRPDRGNGNGNGRLNVNGRVQNSEEQPETTHSAATSAANRPTRGNFDLRSSLMMEISSEELEQNFSSAQIDVLPMEQMIRFFTRAFKTVERSRNKEKVSKIKVLAFRFIDFHATNIRDLSSGGDTVAALLISKLNAFTAIRTDADADADADAREGSCGCAGACSCAQLSLAPSRFAPPAYTPPADAPPTYGALFGSGPSPLNPPPLNPPPLNPPPLYPPPLYPPPDLPPAYDSLNLTEPPSPTPHLNSAHSSPPNNGANSAHTSRRRRMSGGGTPVFIPGPADQDFTDDQELQAAILASLQTVNMPRNHR